MNIPLLKRIQRQLDKQPHLFEMRAYASKDNCDLLPSEDHPCDTSYCIGGWALTLSGLPFGDGRDGLATGDRAAVALELSSYSERHFLFYEANWPEQFQRRPGHKESPEEYAARGIARIEYFIQTGGK